MFLTPDVAYDQSEPKSNRLTKYRGCCY